MSREEYVLAGGAGTSDYIGGGGGGGGDTSGSVYIKNVVPTDAIVGPGESVQFQADIENTTSTDQTVTVSWQLGGSTVATRDQTVGAGSTETLADTATYQYLLDVGAAPGEHTLTGVLSSGSDWPSRSDTWGTLTVKQRYDPSKVSITSCPSASVSEGGSMTHEATVRNDNAADVDVWLKFYADGTEIGGFIQTVPGGGTKTLTGGSHPYSQIRDTVGTGEFEYTAKVHEVRAP